MDWTREAGAQYMLAKGAKRKFSEHEDGVEGKMSCGHGPSKVSYTLQRQTIFNISLMKLYNQQPLMEPSLQKTVLINNMLRRIQEELKQEGSLRPMFIAPSQSSDTLNDNYREVQPAFNHLPAPPVQVTSLASTTSPDSCLTPASILEEDTFSSCQTVELGTSKSQNHSLKDSFSSALDEIEELCPSSAIADSKNCKGASSEGSSEKPEENQEDRPSETRFTDALPGNFEITTTGFLTDLTLDDILFADIDTSMYDFDPCTSTTGSSSKMTAVTADDILKTLSPYSNQSVTPSQPFKMDLAELDHIMEVLVGS
ncbi:SERTA domain-containing protein 2b isoform X1 [Carcharodon carcharias]|uniref:SERTA domain-containing protein 2b isoform X1 n=2 Tax=Carcharodon carcharias TaxID=13397 RepID=UPI001B7E870A|nr:SERTA domain-containing protein 2b isoform X1 [Carcharodon carcharias]XP_041062174.1 SERTA domain-containing protein 2b isoform X1 [Carcharodon carcharias]